MHNVGWTGCKNHSDPVKSIVIQNRAPAHIRMIVSEKRLFDFELLFSLFSTSIGLQFGAFSVCDPMMMNAINSTTTSRRTTHRIARDTEKLVSTTFWSRVSRGQCNEWRKFKSVATMFWLIILQVQWTTLQIPNSAGFWYSLWPVWYWRLLLLRWSKFLHSDSGWEAVIY